MSASTRAFMTLEERLCVGTPRIPSPPSRSSPLRPVSASASASARLAFTASQMLRPAATTSNPRNEAAVASPTPMLADELPQPVAGARRVRLHRLAGQVALDVARRSRWPSRSAGRGPSPAPSSRSSRVRSAAGRVSFFGSVPRLAASARQGVGRAELGARPRRLVLADHRAASPAAPPCSSSLRSNGGLPVSSSYSSTPSEYTSRPRVDVQVVQAGLLRATCTPACRPPPRTRSSASCR